MKPVLLLDRQSLIVISQLACVVLLNISSAHAGVGCANLGFLSCGFSTPTYVNVYWDTSKTQWDTDVSGSASGMTESQLDSFTAALVRSSYFSQLSQYGVTSVSVLPSITASSCGAPPANVDAAISAMTTFELCLVGANPFIGETTTPQVILNIFLPPNTVNTHFCNPGSHGHAAAMHDWPSLALPPFTLIPTTSACTGTPSSVTTALSHEMVEAATDPAPGDMNGWKVPADGEIGDLCENLVQPSFLFGTAQEYWSNSANACVNGFASVTPPSFTPPARVCGTGPTMKFVLNGSFGPAPPDPSVYVRASIFGNDTWTAGTFPGDKVGLGQIYWLQGGAPGGGDQIQILGFNSAYGTPQIVTPGDNVLITVTLPLNGLTATIPVTAPGASQLVNLFVHDLSGLGGTGQVSGIVQDGGGCTVQGASVSLSSSTGTNLSSSSAVTDANGSFTVSFSAPDVAGRVTISTAPPLAASTSFDLLPELDSLHQAQGSTTGLQTTVLMGRGFDASTSVDFGVQNAAVQFVSSDHTTVQLLTPPSPLPNQGVGVVDISAAVNGERRFGLQYDYIRPGVPDMKFIGGIGSGEHVFSCNMGRISVNVYDADGTPQSVPVDLSAGYAAFEALPTKFVSSETVTSGSIITIHGGGPITASNPQVSQSQVTETFPVLTPVECAEMTSFSSQIGQGVFLSPGPFHPTSPACIGDCGSSNLKTVLWGDSEIISNSRNFVAMQAKDASATMNAYIVSGLSEASERSLVTMNPIVIALKAGNKAEFVGPAIQIERARGSTATSTISEPTQISFSIPANFGRSETYTIARLAVTGKTRAWRSDVSTATNKEKGTVTMTVKATGTYALVHLF